MGQANAAVTGTRAGYAAAEYTMASKRRAPDAAEISALKSRLYEPSLRDGGFSPRWVIQQLQNVLFPYYYSIVKHEDRLNAALTTVGFLKSHMGPRIRATDIHELRLAHEARNMVLNAEMILRASLLRRESRGNHYREDYPGRNDSEWLAWIRIKDNDGMMVLIKEPIPEKLLPDLSIPYEFRYPMHYLGEYYQAAQN
jgi:succinate dehydrogenase/fumarate reductase flavoprotein subunit